MHAVYRSNAESIVVLTWIHGWSNMALLFYVFQMVFLLGREREYKRSSASLTVPQASNAQYHIMHEMHTDKTFIHQQTY